MAPTPPFAHRLVARPVRPADRAALARFVEELGESDRRLRFFQTLAELPPRFLDDLVDVDHDAHVAWLALCGRRVIGEARVVRSPTDPGAAEIAYSVVGDWQRRGVARVLLDTLAVVSRHEGIHTWTATVQAVNHRSANLLRSLGLDLTWDEGDLLGRGPVPPGLSHPRAREAALAAHREARLAAAPSVTVAA